MQQIYENKPSSRQSQSPLDSTCTVSYSDLGMLVDWLVGWFWAYQPFSVIKFHTIQFSTSIVFFIYKQLNVKTVQLNVKTVLFQTIQFSISTQFSSI